MYFLKENSELICYNLLVIIMVMKLSYLIEIFLNNIKFFLLVNLILWFVLYV